MSAQILLSMLAPASTATPQGSTTSAAGEFEGLLAGLARAGAGDGSRAVPEPEVEVAADKGVPTDGTAGYLTPPPVAPLLVAPVADPAELPAEAADDTADPAVLADTAVSGSAAAPTTPASNPPATAAAPAPAGVAPPPAEGDAGPEAALPAPAPAPADEAATAPEAPAATAPAAAGSSASAPAAPPPTAAPAPTPLRPLAERTSLPLEEGGTASPSAPAADGAAAPAAAGADAASPPPAEARPATGSAEAAAPAPTAAAAGSDAPAEGPPPAESGSAGSDPATAAARETAPASMSRAAVEATAQIAAQILRRLDSRTTRFEMALLPEELGRVDVKLDIDSEGRLAARLAFDNPAAAADLRGRTDELRRQLEQAGFHLADDAFEFADRDSGSSAFDRGEDPRRGSGRAFTAAARLNAEADAPVARWTSLSLAPAGVDLKV
jgi:flagellar hook-length control protein FliK